MSGRRRGLRPTRVVLENGAVVIAKEANATPAVTIGAVIAAGSAADPLEAPGTAYLLSRVLDRGTGRRSAREIAELLDFKGVTLSPSVTRHSTALWCTALAEDLEPMLALIAEIVRDPSLPEQEVAMRRGEAVTSILQDEDNTAAVAVDRLLAHLYPGGHPYGRRLKGSVESVSGLERRDLEAFHKARFAPASLTVIVVGDVAEERVVDLVEKVFGDWRATSLPPPPLPVVAPPRTRQRLIVPMMNKVQADIAYGLIAVSQADASYHAFVVLNNILGQYGVGGRLGDSIRERQGMAYYAYSTLEASIGPGPLVVRAGVDPRNVDRVLESIEHELQALVASGVREREMCESKRYLAGALPRMLETNDGIAGFLQAAEEHGLGMDYDVRLPDLIRGVSREEVNHLAREFLSPEKAVAVVAGPYGEAEQLSSVPGIAAARG